LKPFFVVFPLSRFIINNNTYGAYLMLQLLS
jgi:hypothetical protein